MAKRGTSKALPPEEIIYKIKKALWHGGGTHDWEDVREGIITGKYQIFWNDDGCVITEIINDPQLRYLHLFIVAGRMPGIFELEKTAEDFGRTQNCKYMTGSGRFGWEKFLPKRGWKKERIVFSKKIEGI